MCDDHKTKKRGISLTDKASHQADHNTWSRRSFLQTLGLTTGAGLAMGGYSVSALGAEALMPLLSSGMTEDRILVLIRLKGGNDGLNTIIPVFDYGNYQSKRPTIHIAENDILSLDQKFGIPSTLNPLIDMWNGGQMKVINTVGYDNHNLSHFTSTDIWSTANPNVLESSDKSGWLGKYILNQDPDYLSNLPDVPGAIKISSGGNISFHNEDMIDLAVNFNTPDRLLSVAETGFIYDTENLPDDCYYGEQVGYIRSILNVTYNYAPAIATAYETSTNAVQYSNNELSRQLSIVARLIKGNLGTKLYMVTLDGFDTHENQNNAHPQLMNALASGVNEFFADLASDDKDKEVLAMTFSEFGRRIAENAGGTDHGTAAPVMMFGPALNGNGILGDDPDLDDVDNNGNLKHSVDFRSIYATILEYWLCIDAEAVDTILGNSFARIPEIGLECMSVSTVDTPVQQQVKHLARPNAYGGTTIEYHTDRPGYVRVEIYTLMGQKLATLQNGYLSAGKHSSDFNSPSLGLSTIPLVYKIEADRKSYSGKFIYRSN